ncbi:MAG: family 16 glycoside hydrolase [Bacteroidota bacterium]
MKISILFILILALFLGACNQKQVSNEWQPMFDGESLTGWKHAAENPGSIVVENGTIKCSGERSHIFYQGNFKNFEFEAEIKTLEKANSGIYIHTKYQEKNYPEKGYEIQINNSHRGSSIKHPERRKTGSIFNIRNIYYPVVKDNEWFKIRIKVVENFIEVFVNDIKVNEYTEPENPWRWDGGEGRKLGNGTIALQSHDPGSTTYFRNLKIMELPKSEKKKAEDTRWDSIVTKLMKAGFPLVDFHVHLKGGLTIDEVVANSQQLGINYGVAPNCGLHFPVTDDKSLYKYMEEVKGSPTFKGMQAEGREWITLFSPEAIAKFDYVFTDAMTFTDYKGRRNRIWIPEEVWVDDKQQFMDQMVEKIEAIFSQEPVDIYVNPTVLPAELMDEYNKLWTRERMKRVVNVLAENGIALEINARYKTPKAEMIKMAKEAGVKFAFGTNNTGRNLGQLEYCLEIIQECGLTPNDMFEPKPNELKPVNVKGLPDKITG